MVPLWVRRILMTMQTHIVDEKCDIIVYGKYEIVSSSILVIYDIVSGIKAGVVPFTTSKGGASYGFELLNTGAIAA